MDRPRRRAARGGDCVQVVEQHRDRVVAKFATIRSGLPSPLTSAAVTESGRLPVAKVCWVAKLGVAAPGAVVLSSTETVSSSSFATIRSGLPSPLTSAAVTEIGSVPVAKVCWVAKLGVVAPGAVVLSSTETVLSSAIRHDQVGLAVAVDVRRRHRVRSDCPWRRSAGRRSWAWPRPARWC